MNYSIETIEKVQQGLMLPVMEHFYTIQGEGFHSGVACYFIRLSGCDLGCQWCDVKESWEQYSYPLYKVEEMVEWVSLSGAVKVVVTGGEPLIHKLDILCDLFRNKGIKCHIETSGAHPYSGKWDWFTLSPKKRKLPLEENYSKAQELKVVISRANDFRFAEEEASKVNDDCKLYLQPEWSKKADILKDIIAYVKINPSWHISLQTHKYMEIP